MHERDELATVVVGLLARRSDPAAVRAAFGSPERFDRDLWRTLCDQVGIAGLAVPEEYDGAGASVAETAVVLTELARALAPAPLLATSFATVALLVGGSAAARAELLPRLAAGEIGTLVWADVAGGLTLDAAAADLVLSLDSGVLRHHPDATATDVPALDPTLRLGRVALGAGTVVGEIPDTDPLRDVCLALVTAEQAGCAARGLEMTVAYSKERVQFGRPIGSFQALKHRMADLLVRTEMMRSAALGATAAAAAYLADPAPERAARLGTLAAAASSYCSDALEEVCAETIQLHGGIGITWEHDAHLVFKRGLSLNALFGPAHTQRARLIPR